MVKGRRTWFVPIHPMNKGRDVTWVGPNVTRTGPRITSTRGQAGQIKPMHHDRAWDMILKQRVGNDTSKSRTSVVSRCHNLYIELFVSPQRTLSFVEIKTSAMLREVLRLIIWNHIIKRSVTSVMWQKGWKVM